jgi:hypothetical protein
VKVVDEILKSHRRIDTAIAILFVVIIALFSASYLSGEIKVLNDKKEEESECIVDAPVEESVIFSECEMIQY